MGLSGREVAGVQETTSRQPDAYDQITLQGRASGRTPLENIADLFLDRRAIAIVSFAFGSLQLYLATNEIQQLEHRYFYWFLFIWVITSSLFALLILRLWRSGSGPITIQIPKGFRGLQAEIGTDFGQGGFVDRPGLAASIVSTLAREPVRHGILSGPSGAGKSPLIRKELAPLLKSAGCGVLYVTDYKSLKLDLASFLKASVPAIDHDELISTGTLILTGSATASQQLI